MTRVAGGAEPDTMAKMREELPGRYRGEFNDKQMTTSKISDLGLSIEYPFRWAGGLVRPLAPNWCFQNVEGYGGM